METTTRREFLKTAATTSAVLAAGSALNAHAAGSDEMRVGIVGCGGRGTDAGGNVLNAADGVRIVAIADVFKPKIEKMREALKDSASKDRAKEFKNTVDLPEERCFVGLDAYEKLINHADVNYIILATPPGFRPLHIAATVAAGKHLFTEKPVGVDGPGIRKVLAAYDDSVKKNLCIAAGTQRRHQLGYVETMKQVHDGAIGDILGLRCYWNGGGIWFYPRKPGMSDVAFQLNNWYHFLWVCGDHIVEQHVHNLDVCNWAMKTHPIRCDGIGSRTPQNPSRPAGPPQEVGNIFDNFSIDYEYPRGIHMYSSCRHIPNTQSNVSEAFVGSKGTSFTTDRRYILNGKAVVTRQQDQEALSPYVQEHIDLINSIRGGKIINELKNVAESTLTAIMGRMAAYTGRPVTWDFALNSKDDTFPHDLTWESSLPVPPVPVPGKTPLI
jgi:myo-inositol 2-dehydrogenase / D-chiro-inositol 1-dehydrogenase